MSSGNFYKNSNNRNKKGLSSNSFNAANHNPNEINHFRRMGALDNKPKDKDMQDRMLSGSQQVKKEMARETLEKAANTKGPVAGLAMKAALSTKKGDKYLDEFAKGETAQEGIKNVAKKVKEDSLKKTAIKFFASFYVLMLLLLLPIAAISSIGGTKIFSVDNEGTVKSEDYNYDDLNINLFKNFPGLYEHVEEVSLKVSKEYKMEIDANLILATLISPIESGFITPIKGDCGEEECYKFDNKVLTWSEFLNNWMQQAEYLARAQVMTYVPKESKEIKVNCGSEETIEQYSKNDKEISKPGPLSWLNPFNWFKGFTDDKAAEVNAKCPDMPFGKSKVPIVRRLSIELPEYYKKVDQNGDLALEKDSNTGGVYFWNLVNKDGFIHKYLKDYLDTAYIEDSDKNYEINKMKIVDIANEIYLFHETTKITCGDYRVLESTIKNIKVKPKGASDDNYEEIPFEEQYLGGVILAEYNMGQMESEKAFAILARGYAIAVVGVDGEGVIENSSNNQNYNPNYSPEKYPKIAQAVEETRGMVLTKPFSAKVIASEYDAFCPVKRDMENGFYYLPDGQRNLPINPAAFNAKIGRGFNPPEKYLLCPCFQNNDSQPHDEIIDRKKIKYSESPSQPNLEAAGTPPQITFNECWTPTDYTRNNPVTGAFEYGWKYKATGGHGRGASQYGLYYFEGFGYDYIALDRLFYDGSVIRYLSSSIDMAECPNAIYLKDK